MHPLLNKHHQQLINLLDDLEKCISTGVSVNQVNEYLSNFVALAEKEFKNEETVMETFKYTDIISHKNEHAALLKELYVLKNKLASGHTPFGQNYMQSLKRWLDGHLFGADRRLNEFLNQINVNNNSSDS